MSRTEDYADRQGGYKTHTYLVYEERIKAIIKIIDDSDLPQKEKDFRARRISDEFNELGFSDRFYQLAHEIKCMQFLSKYGNLNMAKDNECESQNIFIMKL